MALSFRAFMLAVLLVSGAFQLASTPVSAAPAPGSAACDPVLSRDVRGEHALDQADTNLDDIAQRNDMDVNALRDQLRTDDSLWLDRCGRVFFVEPETAPASDADASASATLAAPYPTSRTFKLHSRTGAKRVIYLDFNGHSTANTSWNDRYTNGNAFSSPSYDIDDSPQTFSAEEHAIIQNVWREVSEDYAPFSVDVTTEDPGAAAIDRASGADTVFGTRAVITTTNRIDAVCGCGGIAYLGVFDDTWDHSYYQPAFAFTLNSWGVETRPKMIAGIVSHEVGHNLGLQHDGTSTVGYYEGQGSWAPIMGVTWNYPISQWSKGDYADANNKQDDFQVMQDNGAPLRYDDHSNYRSRATVLTPATRRTVAGRITTARDIDWFAFTGSGFTKLNAIPAPTGPNLDIRLSIYNSSGKLLKRVNPVASALSFDVARGLNAVTALTLPAAGTYYVSVEGVGNGNPQTTGYSDYGSVGTYKLTITTVVP